MAEKQAICSPKHSEKFCWTSWLHGKALIPMAKMEGVILSGAKKLLTYFLSFLSRGHSCFSAIHIRIRQAYLG